MCSIVLGGATWGCVGAAVELQLSSYAMGGGVWSLKVVFGWFCEVCSWFRRASDWLLFVGWVAAIVLSWGNGCTTSNPWGFAACRNASNQNSSSALMKPWGFMGCMHG